MDTSLNFVALVETNPITRLNGDYNNKFVNKIKETFTETQQQLFVSSLYCYLNYHPTNDFVVDLDNIWQWLGFSQKAMAKRTMEKHFVVDKDYKTLLCRLAEQKTDTRGGHNKETVLLNVQTFKLFCIKADTKKAHEIHEYFIKLEELMQTIVQEESNELKLQLEQVNQQNVHLENSIIQTQQTAQQKIQLERQNILLHQFNSNMNVVYIIRVKKYDDGEYVIKIGESRRGIEGRFNEHKSNYEDPLLLDCFAVKKSKDFERFLHTHENIRPYNVKNLPNHETEYELFRIGNGLTYHTLQRIIHQNMQRFNDLDEKYFEDMLSSVIEKTNLQTQPIEQNTLIQNMLQNQQQMLRHIQVLEQIQTNILEKLNSMQTRTTTGFQTPLPTLGERLQRIHPETMVVDKVYDSVTECMREYNFKIKRPSINKAVEQNTIYHGYRWAFVGRDQDPNTNVQIAPTKPIRIQQVGYVAQLTPDKTEILHVYLDRKHAAKHHGYSSSALDNPVKNGTLFQGHFYMLYEHCPEHVQQRFVQEKNQGNPIVLYVDGIGQYNGEQQLLREFVCKYDCVQQIGISDRTLNRSIETQNPYHNFYYRRLGKKEII